MQDITMNDADVSLTIFFRQRYTIEKYCDIRQCILKKDTSKIV